MLVVRRTTFEWVLRQRGAGRAARLDPHRTRPSTGLTVAPATTGRRRSTGVHARRRHQVLGADVVVAAMGRRSPVPGVAGRARRRRRRRRSTRAASCTSRAGTGCRPARPRGARPEARRRPRLREVPRRAGRRRHALDHARDPARRRRAARGAHRSRRLRAGVPAPARARPVLPRRSARAGRRRPADGRPAQPDPPLHRRRRRAARARVPRGRRRAHLHQPALRPRAARSRSCRRSGSPPRSPSTRTTRPRGRAPSRPRPTREVRPSYEFAVQMDRMGADPAGAGALAGDGGAGGKAMAAVFVGRRHRSGHRSRAHAALEPAGHAGGPDGRSRVPDPGRWR